MTIEALEIEVSDQAKIERVKSSYKMHKLESVMQANYPPASHTVMHRFTPGMYIRTVLVKAGILVTSKIHRFEHPFFVMTGSMTWYNEVEGEEGSIFIKAPYFGITKPGTWRAIVVHEDVIMTACYATELTDVAEIERTLIEPHFIPENTYNQEIPT